MTLAARYSTPRVIVRNRTQTLTLAVYQDGELASITEAGSTLSVFDSSWTAIVDESAVAVDGDGFASYALSSATVPETLPLSTQWMERWRLVIDGVVEEFRRDCVLAYQDVRPHVTDADLLDRASDLGKLLPPGQSSWQRQIDAAWTSIQRRLLSDGRRHELILSEWSLFDAHLALSLARIYRDLETNTQGRGKYAEQADRFQREYDDAWGSLQIRYYDAAETGKPVDAVPDLAVPPVIYLTGRPGGWR